MSWSLNNTTSNGGGRLWLKIIGWNISLILVGLLVIEGVFGSWFRAPQLWSLSIYRNKDWTLSVKERYPGYSEINYRRDYFGLRGNYGDPEDAHIVALGGSTTDERFVSEGETWPDIMGQCLSENRSKINVANAGVTGQTTRGHIYNFDVWLNYIPGLKPDYFVALFGINERAADVDQDWDFVHRWNESDRDISYLKIFRKWVYMNSAVYTAFRTIKGNFKAHEAGVGPLAGKNFDRRVFPSSTATKGLTFAEKQDLKFSTVANRSMEIGSDAFKEKVAAYQLSLAPKLKALKIRLKTLRQRILDFGSIPVFVTQSWGLYRLENGVVRGDIDFYLRPHLENRTVMEFCRETGTRCINLGEELPFTDGDFWDAAHTTPKGSRKVGEFICERLKSWDQFYKQIDNGRNG